MAKQTFTSNQVLTAAQMTSLQQTAMGGGAATTKTTSYVLVAADAGTTVTMTSASATTITVNTALFAAGDTVYIQNLGAGISTITAGTATVNTSSSLALAQYEGGQLYFNSTSAAIFVKGAGASAAASTSLTLLNAGGTALTGAATITINVSSYNFYNIFCNGASSTSASSVFTLRINNDSGGNYRYQGISYTANTTFARVQQIGASSLAIATMGNSASTDSKFSVLVNGGAGTGVKTIQTFSGGDVSSTDVGYVIGGSWDNASAITSFVFISSLGNFDSGTVYIYGGN